MKLDIRRNVRMFQSVEKTQIGDVIQFDLTTGETVQAMKMTDDGIWCFVDCLEDECDMHDMEQHLESVLSVFPDDIRELMKPFDDGRLLRLPTEKEVFGKNVYGKKQPMDVQQWEPMKLRRNRIAFQGLNGGYEWWWTETPHKNGAAFFADVYRDGGCSYGGASGSGGVRPAFRF